MQDKNFLGFLVGATSSGSGKTLITCALLRILEKKGYKPASFKCGPDYIDPMFHKKVLGIPARNLDIFLAGEDGIKSELSKGALGRDICVAEGVMGLFDGSGASSYKGSSYEISEITGLPIILVVNCKGMSHSVIPLVKGFCDYDMEGRIEGRIKGIILNNLSPMIADTIIEAVENAVKTKVLGYLPPIKDLSIGSRHLGLIMPSEIPEVLDEIDRVSEKLEEHLDITKLIEIAGYWEAEGLRNQNGHIITSTNYQYTDNNALTDSGKENMPSEKIRIGIAMDEAFSFYYEANLDLLKEKGAEIVPFSPIHDKQIPDVSRLIIGGGYPELYAADLAQNTSMMRSIRAAANAGMPILAECGGFLYLLESLTDMDGKEHKMTGIFSGKSHYTGKLSHFGYVNVIASEKNPYLCDNEIVRAHEFHYYDTSDNGCVCKISKPGKNRFWQGYRQKGNVFAGFAHLYYPSCEAFIDRFLQINTREYN